MLHVETPNSVSDSNFDIHINFFFVCIKSGQLHTSKQTKEKYRIHYIISKDLMLFILGEPM